MLLSNRTRRGFSLTEVIVALFIMAIGIISLLTLFPLGAVQMGKALRDDRSQTTGVIADGKMRMLWLGQLDGTYPTQPFYAALDVGNGALATSRAGLPGPSYPVLFDPVGFTTHYGTPKSASIASVAGVSGIARRSTLFTTMPNSVLSFHDRTTTDRAANFCSMPDDLTFKENAVPALGDTTGLLVRQGRFNFALMLQRPNNSIPEVTGMKILVFDRRVPGISANNENQYPTIAPIAIGDTQLTFSTPNMGLRTGSWIMDGTINTALGIRNANFYRVVSVEEVAGITIVDLETPISKPSGEYVGTTYTPTIIVFQELIDVFDRPDIAPSTFVKAQP